MRKGILSLIILLFVLLSSNKCISQEKPFLDEQEQQELFSKIQKDPIFLDFLDATIELTLVMFKTVQQGGKVDTLKISNSLEKNLAKKLEAGGITNSQEVVELSNKQLSFMKELMEKYPLIRKVPFSEWNSFIETQNKPLLKEKMAVLNNSKN